MPYVWFYPILFQRANDFSLFTRSQAFYYLDLYPIIVLEAVSGLKEDNLGLPSPFVRY